MEDPRHSTSNWATVPFAIFAAFGGMSCAYAAAGALRWTGGLFAPFFIGGVVTALLFWLLIRTSAVESELPRGRERERRADRTPAESSTDSRTEWTTVFLSVATLFTVAGAIAVGAGDGGLPTARHEAVDVWVSRSLESAFAGFMLSLPIAGSASALVWVLRRGR